MDWPSQGLKPVALARSEQAVKGPSLGLDALGSDELLGTLSLQLSPSEKCSHSSLL